MQSVPVIHVGSAMQMNSSMFKRRACILSAWAVVAAVALRSGTKQFFQPAQNNRWEMPEQLQFRPKSTQWSPFSQFEQQPSWPFQSEQASSSFTASTAGTLVAAIAAVAVIANGIITAPANVDSAIGNDSVFAQETPNTLQSSLPTGNRMSLFAAIGSTEDGSSTTKKIAGGVTEGMKNLDMFEGTDLAGVFDEGADPDINYSEWCQAEGGIC